MTSNSRKSNPIFLDRTKGRFCGNCLHCSSYDPYNPGHYGWCKIKSSIVNIRRQTNCERWA